MNKNTVIAVVALFLLSGTLLVSGIATADDDEHNYRFWAKGTLPSVNNQLYKAECGSCHFAYQAGWLPARSWKKMMNELDDHFGENAELSDEPRVSITNYLMSEAADVKSNSKSRKVLRSIRENEAPQRISTLSYMQHKHDDLSARHIENNPKVRSLSNCVACHRGAEKGQFDEHGVNVPGFGFWED